MFYSRIILALTFLISSLFSIQYSYGSIDQCKTVLKKSDDKNTDGEPRMVIPVSFSDANIYRRNIGIKLYEEALRINPKGKVIVEIGPGSGDVAKSMTARDSLVDKSLFVIEPDASKKSTLLEVTSEQNIFQGSFESAVSSGKIPNSDIVIANFSLHWVENLNIVLQELSRSINRGGVIAISNTDVSRSFWAEIDEKVKKRFPGSSLYNINISHSMSPQEWVELIESLGFKSVYLADFHGTAALMQSAEFAFSEFKRMAGAKYLRLGNGISQIEIEEFVMNELLKNSDSMGRVKVKASGFAYVATKKE